ncbi:MAG: CoA transferase [Dehalococcoidia bacterium]
MAAPLQHLRVLDLTDERGSLAGRLLAELGADVLLVEPPGGSPARRRPPYKDGTPHVEGSLHFLYFNAGKRSAVVDIVRERDTFEHLLRDADAVLLSGNAADLDDAGLTYEALSAVNPSLVVTSVTAFGRTGPRAHWRGDDLVANAVGGMTYIVGEPDRAPVTPPEEQAYQMAGVHAAWGTLLALYDRWDPETGAVARGQHVDVSLQEIAAHQFFVLARYSAPDAVIIGRTGGASGIVPNTVYPCRDGLVRISIFEARQYRWLVEWMDDAEIASPEFDLREVRAAAADLINERIATWTRQHMVGELLTEALARRIPMAPMNTPADFLESAYAVHRKLFARREHPYVGRYQVPQANLAFSATPPNAPGVAPLLDEHGPAIRGELASAAPRAPRPAMHLRVHAPRPFEGIRVLDFTRVWSGPYGTRFLADHGAEVIKVESRKRPDNRPQPGLPEEMAVQANSYFAENNRNKHGIAVDLTTPRGIEIIRELAAHCDVVTENNSPGVMDRLGIGYGDLRKVRPDIVFVSMPGFGAGTPDSGFVAYGGTLMCYTGMSYLWGLEDSPLEARCQLAYPDYITAAHVPLVTLAALHHRALTGEGQAIEIPQIDSAAAFTGVAYLDHLVNGTRPEPLGNHGRAGAPRGVYPCRGADRWVAISVETDAEWHAFCRAALRPDWSVDPRFASAEARRSNRAALDAAVEEWTLGLTPLQVARVLQYHGVSAGAVQTGEDLYTDSHLRARNYVLPITHPGIGAFEHPGYTVQLSATPGTLRRPAPQLGADTVDVVTRVLGMGTDEARRLVDEGVLA